MGFNFSKENLGINPWNHGKCFRQLLSISMSITYKKPFIFSIILLVCSLPTTSPQYKHIKQVYSAAEDGT